MSVVTCIQRYLIHWDPLTRSSVTTSSLLQRSDFFASKSLTVKKFGHTEHPLTTISF